MSAIDAEPFPRWPLIAAGCLIAVSITATALVRISRMGEPAPAVQAEREVESALSVRTLTFLNQPDESLIVMDAAARTEIARIAKEDSGFIYGVMRGLRRSRMIHQAPIDPTVTIAAYADGRFVMTDTSAGAVIDLNAFGADNRKVFAQFLPPPKQVAAAAAEAHTP